MQSENTLMKAAIVWRLYTVGLVWKEAAQDHKLLYNLYLLKTVACYFNVY